MSAAPNVRRLARPVRAWACVVALAAAGAARAGDGDSLAPALDRIARGDVSGAAALAQAWCERHPDDAEGWFALGYCRARSKEWSVAILALGRAQHGGAAETTARVRFDLAKALFEKARATALPALPEAGTPPAGLVADARTRLAIVRLELESARDALIALIDGAPADADARRGLSAATALLREVVARDDAWRARSKPAEEGTRGQGQPASEPLKRGPSGTKSSAGASGKKFGRSDDGANGAAPGGVAGGESSGIETAPLRPDEAAGLLDSLRGALEERRRADERRADARARLRGRSN